MKHPVDKKYYAKLLRKKEKEFKDLSSGIVKKYNEIRKIREMLNE